MLSGVSGRLRRTVTISFTNFDGGVSDEGMTVQGVVVRCFEDSC